MPSGHATYREGFACAGKIFGSTKLSPREDELKDGAQGGRNLACRARATESGVSEKARHASEAIEKA